MSTLLASGATPYKPKHIHVMKMENAIRIVAGTMVLISISLAHWVSQWWLLLACFVGTVYNTVWYTMFISFD